MDALPAHLSPRKSSAGGDANGVNSPGLTFRGRSTPRGSNASAHDMEMSYSAGGSGHGGVGHGQMQMPPGGLPSPTRYGGGYGDAGAMGASGSGHGSHHGASTLNPEVRKQRKGWVGLIQHTVHGAGRTDGRAD